jgi:hypothetical protein
MNRALYVLLLAAVMALPGTAAPMPRVYRVEGQALAAQPDFPVSAGKLTVECSDPADEAYPVRILGLGQSRSALTESVTTETALSFLRVNRARWHGPAPGPVGTVTIKHGEIVMAMILPSQPSSFEAVFSVGPGRAGVVLAEVVGDAVIWHRAGANPHSAKIVDVDSGAAGIGDFYAIGVPGDFVQFELVR